MENLPSLPGLTPDERISAPFMQHPVVVNTGSDYRVEDDKTAMIKVKAEFNVLTRQLRNAQLLEFVEYVDQIDEASLARLTRRGERAWKDVSNPTAWVDELRGGGCETLLATPSDSVMVPILAMSGTSLSSAIWDAIWHPTLKR